MANFDGYSIEELSRLARFIVRVKFDPPIDEKCFIDEPNRLLDGTVGQPRPSRNLCSEPVCWVYLASPLTWAI
jgi:hypothetical protein